MTWVTLRGMPWNTMTREEQRLSLVIELLKPDCNVSGLCRQFGISRKTAYKWKERFKSREPDSLRDGSRAPKANARAYDVDWHLRLERLRREHPLWGAKKLAQLLKQELAEGEKKPSVAALGRWLREDGLLRKQSRRARKGPRVPGPPPTAAKAPNDVWTVDFKGWFRTADGWRCEPLTVRDLHSRYILGVFMLKAQSDGEVRRCFVKLFKKHGLPKAIRSDNGAPFGGRGPLGFSRLSVWWTRLNIQVEFTRRAHPQDNGGHEQMHRVMKAQTAQPAGRNARAQKRRTRFWVEEYNWRRPHEALGQMPPGLFYEPSKNRLPRDLKPLHYGNEQEVRRVRNRGTIKWRGRLRFVGRAFVGESMGLKEVRPDVMEVYLGILLVGELHELDPGGMRPVSRLQKSQSRQNAGAQEK